MDSDEHEARIVRLLADLEAAERDAPELDPNDVARLVGGAVDPEIRATLTERMGAEDAGVVASLAGARAGRRNPRIRRRWWPAAAAAVVVLAFGGWLLLQADSPPVRAGDPELAAVFRDLEKAAPDVFAGLLPLGEDERAGGGRPVQRGGIRVMGPHEAILDRRPTLRWEAVRGAAAYHVEVLSDEGDVVLATTTAGSVLAWPSSAAPLQAGIAYVLRVAATVGGVRVEGSRAFRVASEAVRVRYAHALTIIDATAARELQAVARAHTAFRLGLVSEAARQLEGDVPAAARQLAAETRAYLARRLGRN